MRTESVPSAARRQHGAFTRAQARASGLSDRVIDAAVARGVWRRVHRGVYTMAGAPTTDLQRLMAAVLAAGSGAVASHRSAARLWGLAEADPLEVTVPSGRSPRVPGVSVHRRRLGSSSRRHGIPVTNPLRFTWDDVCHRSGEVTARIRQALGVSRPA